MSVISEFMEHYGREVDYFSAAAVKVQERLETALAIHGVRAIVTSRAKGIRRLRDKVEKRNRTKRYKTLKGIYADIIDLAGARIALYFPGDRDKVDSIIKEVFEQVRSPKVFPEKRRTINNKRFMGYVATHYLVRLKPDADPEIESRYSGTCVEIQVASVLMHGWAEVEHDLEYKPESGEISDDESAILDELNGLVLTGELALERLQKAIQRRIGKENQQFRDEFELASFLSQKAHREGMDKKNVGRVDALFAVLRHEKMATPSKVSSLTLNLENDEHERPIADVLIDRLLSKSKRKRQLTEILSSVLGAQVLGVSANKRTQAIGVFLVEWQQVEKLIYNLAGLGTAKRHIPFSIAIKSARLQPDLAGRLYAGSILRNRVVHGTFTADLETLENAISSIREITSQLSELLRRRDKIPKRLAAPSA